MDERTIDGHSTRTSPLMYLALAAGVFVGTKMANSAYRAVQRHRQAESQREQIKRWEDEGGAIGSTVGAQAERPAAPGA